MRAFLPSGRFLALFAGLVIAALVIGRVLVDSSPLNASCEQVNADPLHFGIEAADAVYDSLPEQSKQHTDLQATRITVTDMCAQASGSSVRQVREDLIGSLK